MYTYGIDLLIPLRTRLATPEDGPMSQAPILASFSLATQVASTFGNWTLALDT